MALEQKIADEIAACAPYFEKVPAAVMIHNLHELTILYMSPIGLKTFGVTMQELTDMGIDYYPRFFNPEEAKEYLPKIFDMLERNNDDEMVTFFQHMRTPTETEPEWNLYLSSTKIFARDEEGKPSLTITTFTPCSTQYNLPNKTDHILQDGDYLKEKKPLFDSLTQREREIIQLMAKGMNSAEIATVYFCSIDTVKTHRRNIKRKLEIESNYDIFRLAHAFGLV